MSTDDPKKTDRPVPQANGPVQSQIFDFSLFQDSTAAPKDHWRTASIAAPLALVVMLAAVLPAYASVEAPDQAPRVAYPGAMTTAGSGAISGFVGGLYAYVQAPVLTSITDEEVALDPAAPSWQGKVVIPSDAVPGSKKKT